MGTSKQRSYEEDVPMRSSWVQQAREVMKKMSPRGVQDTSRQRLH
ncbi:hypothetical protein [Bacillus sp. P14.5]|nr:hypothetical protein [Bacillus sp. P14.5]